MCCEVNLFEVPWINLFLDDENVEFWDWWNLPVWHYDLSVLCNVFQLSFYYFFFILFPMFREIKKKASYIACNSLGLIQIFFLFRILYFPVFLFWFLWFISNPLYFRLISIHLLSEYDESMKYENKSVRYLLIKFWNNF